jgi:hypothetical protein
MSMRILLVFTFLLSSFCQAESGAWFQENNAWEKVSDSEVEISPVNALRTNGRWGDHDLEFEFLLEGNAQLNAYVMGRYALQLNKNKSYESDVSNSGALMGGPGEGDFAPIVGAAKDGGWQHLKVEFRGPRYDEAMNKAEPALFLKVYLNGQEIHFNTLAKLTSRTSIYGTWEAPEGPLIIDVLNDNTRIRNFKAQKTDYSALVLPGQSGEASNRADLVDLVSKGKSLFQDVGCAQCHSVSEGDQANKTGPNLYGLFQTPIRDRLVEQGEGHRFSVKADETYFKNSLRSADFQRALYVDSDNAYAPIMPSYPEQVIGDLEERALYAYLQTLNSVWHTGPAIFLANPGENTQYNVLEDRFQFIVSDRTRIQRGPLPGVSARAIHVGSTNGVHYSFDPRVLGVAKLWQGGYIDASGELRNRGGKGLKLGHESQEVPLGSLGAILLPLQDLADERSTVDFSFKEAVFGDNSTVAKSLNSPLDQAEMIKRVNAKFLGFELDSKLPDGQPWFKFRVANSEVKVRYSFEGDGQLQVDLISQGKSALAFLVNTEILSNIEVSAGELKSGKWITGEGKATLKAQIGLAERETITPNAFDFNGQPLVVKESEADLPKGYSIESYMPPKDNLGREQLFEALGMAQAKNGTIVVSTRTAGIWHLHKGKWTQFAQGSFDSLGVLVEDSKGRDLIVGQKAELSRVRDTNGDGIADVYETLFDAHSYHGNYHSYMHGPTRAADGEYVFAINLAHMDEAIYKAGGKYMGTQGGYAGWAIKVSKDGTYKLFANGLRSPASIGTSPEGNVYYADNQGEYMGTSQMFEVTEGAFFGHPSGLVDLPGMTPESDEIKWDNVKQTRSRAVLLFPHNRLANSPGNPAWESKGGFGPNSSDMYIGDQTQSNLLRVGFEEVGGQKQGYVIPFMAGLESGVMRPVFLKDGSLLLGQTGRGWQAKGGQVASMQHVRRTGKLTAQIESIETSSKGFVVHFTQKVEPFDSGVVIESWAYRDAPDYGSPELGNRQEAIKSLSWNNAKSLSIELQELRSDRVHEDQSAWIYYLKLPGGFEAYYSAYVFPAP